MTIELRLDGFLDDYFAECDQHLTDARRHLLALEAAVASPGSETQTLDELFRIFHSIKGISGMVELREAERLAHEMESYLRSLRSRESLLSASGVDALIDGAQRLEQVVAARSRGSAIPSIADIETRLTALAPEVPTGPTAAIPPMRAVPGAASNARVRFRPSRELAEQGIGVDAVRRYILERATVLETVPKVDDDGSIEFVFLVNVASGSTLDGVSALQATVEPVAPDPDVARRLAMETERSGLLDRPTTSHFVRVNLERLDELMRQVGDLVISRARLADSLAPVESAAPGAWRTIQENAGAIDRQLRSLREGIMRVRLVPIGEIFGRMPLVVRDLARSFGRRVDLQVSGQGTEIDKYLVERMMDSVLHLVRNAIAHGIETPEERIAAGKSPQGTIHLSASTSGDLVNIVVADDGRGIDVDRVVRTATAAGLEVPPGLPSDATLLRILCAQGFSTRETSDRAAGRGVGMSVVKAAVEQLSGSLSVDGAPGKGTRFTIQLPLTLAITDALIARVGDQTFAVPQGGVREVLELDPSSLHAVEQQEVMPHRHGALRVLRLGRLFGIEGASPARLHVFVSGQDANTVGIIVDRIVGQREIVVRPIADPLVRVDGVSGATDLGDGRVVLILDPPGLFRMAKRHIDQVTQVRAASWRPREIAS